MATKTETKADVILAAALREFIKTGYMGTSLDRIAKAAKVSKPTLYSYFHDKASLFEAVIKGQIQTFSQDMTKLSLDWNFQVSPDPNSYPDPRTLLLMVLNRLLDRMLNNTDQHHEIVRLLLGESGRFPNLAQQVIASVHKPVIDRLSHLLTTHPQIHCADPRLTACTLFGSLIYYTMTQHMLQSALILPIDRDIYLNNLVSLALTPPSPESQRF
ncbi:MAG: TetR/AcrR family transcriptional regulator [Prochlorothrix sp.]